MKPVRSILPDVPPLESRGDRPLKFTFENQLDSLVYHHLFKNESGRDLLQKFRGDDFAKKHIVPEAGISRNSFFEALNSRGEEQLQYVFQELCLLFRGIIPWQYSESRDIVLIPKLSDSCSWVDSNGTDTGFIPADPVQRKEEDSCFVSDRKYLLRRMDGNENLVKIIVENFPSHFSEELEKLKISVQEKHAEKIRFYAHTLKGMAANSSAARLRNAALALETDAKQGRTDRAHSLLKKVEQEFGTLVKVLMQEEGIGYSDSGQLS